MTFGVHGLRGVDPALHLLAKNKINHFRPLTVIFKSDMIELGVLLLKCVTRCAPHDDNIVHLCT
jgi:hypothetical protein